MPDQPDLVIVGGGPAGYDAAFMAAKKGLAVRLYEKNALGGTCLHTGCIPTKTLLQATKYLASWSKQKRFGIKTPKPSIDLKGLQKRRQVVVEKLERGLHTRLKRAGIELVREEVDLSSAKDQGQNLLIATGTRPRVISGTLSTDEALLIDEVPESIVLLGAGAVGIELATYFSQLGSKVELCDLAGQVLPGHISADIVKLLQRQLTRARIKLSLNMNSDIDWSAESRLVVSCAGRLVNDRGFFELGLQQDSKGYLLVDEWQKTSQNGIYAAGDVTGQWQLAHAASLAGRRAVQAIIGNKQQQPSAIMPWCVFSDPPLAVVGKLDGPETIMVDFRDLGISQARAETDGVLRAVYDRERQIITGLQILGPGADDLLGAATLLVSQEVPLRDFAQLPWAHPTAVEIFGLLADAIGW